MSCTTSECITTPSSLIRAHAPDHKPLDVYGFTSTSSLCRLPSAPAGLWPFPTLSPRSLYGCLDPYPVVSFRCLCSFLPGRLRPHVRIKTFGTQNIIPAMQLPQGETFRGCSHSFIFRLPYLLDLQAAPTAVSPQGSQACLPPACRLPVGRQGRQGRQAVYTTHRPARCRFRDVASLRVRHEQLTRLDFHQLDRGLVGRSLPHRFLSLRSEMAFASGMMPPPIDGSLESLHGPWHKPSPPTPPKRSPNRW